MIIHLLIVFIEKAKILHCYLLDSIINESLITRRSFGSNIYISCRIILYALQNISLWVNNFNNDFKRTILKMLLSECIFDDIAKFLQDC